MLELLTTDDHQPTTLSLVRRLPVQQIERMRQQIDHGSECVTRPRRAPRKIEDQTRSARSTHSATQCSEACLAYSFRTYLLGNAFDQTVADRTSSFGSDVAGSNPGSAGRHNQ